MNAQEKEELLDYLKATISLETDVATQKSIIETYNQIWLDKKPKLCLTNEPFRPSSPSIIDTKSDGSGIGYALFVGIVFILCGIPMFFTSSTTIGVISCLIGAGCLFQYTTHRTTANTENEKRKIEYQNALDDYQANVTLIQKRNQDEKLSYNKNMELWNKSYNENRTVLYDKLIKSNALLEKMYTKDFIYPKYHNLPALTSIYEYLLIGRCDELSGPHGAYKLYEDEVRNDTVISQLNIVIENLEQIKQNQYMLYQQAKMISDNVSAVKDELSTISGYTVRLTELTALNTYYSAMTARNTSITAAYNLLNG